MTIAFVGGAELLVIAGLAVLIFGAKKLPQLGAGLGQGIRNFKESVTNKDDEPIEAETKASPDKD